VTSINLALPHLIGSQPCKLSNFNLNPSLASLTHHRSTPPSLKICGAVGRPQLPVFPSPQVAAADAASSRVTSQLSVWETSFKHDLQPRHGMRCRLREHNGRGTRTRLLQPKPEATIVCYWAISCIFVVCLIALFLGAGNCQPHARTARDKRNASVPDVVPRFCPFYSPGCPPKWPLDGSFPRSSKEKTQMLLPANLFTSRNRPPLALRYRRLSPKMMRRILLLP
jgi:hypothetical protein